MLNLLVYSYMVVLNSVLLLSSERVTISVQNVKILSLLKTSLKG